MSAITPEMIEEEVKGARSEIALDGGSLLHSVIVYLSDEVEHMRRERDTAIDERTDWMRGAEDLLYEKYKLQAEVQRLTEEAQLVRVINEREVWRWKQETSDAKRELAETMEDLRKSEEASRSDAGRVEVPDCSEARRIGAWACFLIYDVLLRPDLVAKLPWSIRSDDLPRLLEDAKQGERLLSAIPAPAQNTVEVPERRWTGGYPDLAPHPRLSPSPQPATEAVLTCDDCDSREGCPKRGTPCMYHMSHSDHQPSADVVVVPREEYLLLQTCESMLRGSGPVYFSGRPLDDLDRLRSTANESRS